MACASTHPLGRFGASGRRTQQLHQLFRRGLRLLAQLRRQPRRQLEVVLRVPVVRRGFDGAMKFFLGAREPAEPRLGIVFGARLLKNAQADQKCGDAASGERSAEIDRVVEALEAGRGSTARCRRRARTRMETAAASPGRDRSGRPRRRSRCARVPAAPRPTRRRRPPPRASTARTRGRSLQRPASGRRRTIRSPSCRRQDPTSQSRGPPPARPGPSAG